MPIQSQTKRVGFLCCAVFLCGCVFACGGAGNEISTDAAQSSNIKNLRIIIGFKGQDANPREPALIQKISNELNTDLVFVRALAGGAAVYSGAFLQSEEEILAGLDRLQNKDFISYAELDQRRSIQPAR